MEAHVLSWGQVAVLCGVEVNLTAAEGEGGLIGGKAAEFRCVLLAEIATLVGR